WYVLHYFSYSGAICKPRGRIVGGEPTIIENFPHQVSVRINGRHVCGGSIIGKQWIVTAAHCVYGSSVTKTSIKAGISNLIENGTVINAVNIITHEKYDPITTDNDIAVIELEYPLDYDRYVSPVNLPSSDEKYFSGQLATITGWGRFRYIGTLSLQLRRVDVPLVERALCEKLYSDYLISEGMLCAGYVPTGGKDGCQGDSGGPMIINRKLVGIVSWGVGCAAPNRPGVYTRVTLFRNWIKEKSGV
ncbi:trypsin-1, partial [Cephus cinctus]|uniref:Trypsin-1 n=1 Tax=Cephus cinctus TaxID=211228 RepID=A0AAJ7CEI2_CEPCN